MDRIKLPPEPIRRRIEAHGGVAPGEARWTPAAGGLSAASVWRLEGGERPLAVRCWGAEADARRIDRISQTLRAIHRAGSPAVSAPQGEPIHDETTGLWEWSLWRRGAPLSGVAQDPAAIGAVMAGLAAFHKHARAEPGDGLPIITIEDRFARLDGLKQPASAIDPRSSEAWPELAELRRRLPGATQRATQAMRAIDWSDTSVQVIHGDARPEHFLIEEGELTGLIDFGALRRDTPWADLARLAGELGRDRVEEVASLYERAGGRPVNRAAVAALDLAGAALSAANWARWLQEPDRVWPRPDRVRERLRSVADRLL